MEDIVDTFEIISSDGKKYVVNEWKKRNNTSTLNSHSKTYTYEKLATLKTTEGYLVSPTNDGKFLILDLNIECEKIKKT